eukprot:TRINITY_DN8645_c0_g1_i3.p5 TRINITY_DN8645_c0_g1~~TRINITY_DN8645_c0_g1_i3.p5  ORF type:complete len:210 (-),score=2.48 TRINITY_DN8645_c0_g1_i3:1282-1911(-)
MSSGQTLGVKAQRFRGHTSPHRNVKEKKNFVFNKLLQSWIISIYKQFLFEFVCKLCPKFTFRFGQGRRFQSQTILIQGCQCDAFLIHSIFYFLLYFYFQYLVMSEPGQFYQRYFALTCLCYFCILRAVQICSFVLLELFLLKNFLSYKDVTVQNFVAYRSYSKQRQLNLTSGEGLLYVFMMGGGLLFFPRMSLKKNQNDQLFSCQQKWT